MKTWKKVVIGLVVLGVLYYFYVNGYFSTSTAPAVPGQPSDGGLGVTGSAGGSAMGTQLGTTPTQGGPTLPPQYTAPGGGTLGITPLPSGGVQGPAGQTFTQLPARTRINMKKVFGGLSLPPGSNHAPATSTPSTPPGYHVAPAPTTPAVITTVPTHSHQTLIASHASLMAGKH